MVHDDKREADAESQDYQDYLRPEAGPVPYAKLQWRAQKALNKIIGALRAATRTAKGRSDDASMDANRASRIIFVSGEPGSGKSTLYLTLKEMLSDSEKSDRYRQGYKEQIGDLKNAVRWLDPLDLEVAGDEGENLLAAVLVRLIEALSGQEQDITILSKPCADAIKDLEELATGIGIAWEGNLRERAGHLDPDTFSEEVMRTQRERLGVNERLRKVLNDLANNGCFGCGKKTLFVLPVDDFYLKPDASLQLLRLLRMISVPRLFFLVMGDITTIEALFIEKSLADWTKVAGAEIFATLPRQRQDEALARARELRARYLRKLLPPLQRETIEAMDWDEALDFAPELPDGDETKVSSLESLLGEKELDQPPGETNPDIAPEPNGEADGPTKAHPAKSLMAFVLDPPFSQQEKDKREAEKKKDKRNAKKHSSAEGAPPPPDQRQQKMIRKAREAYTALQILDATPREIMDLWFALRHPGTQDSTRPGDSDPPPQLLSLVEDAVQLSIEEQNFLTEDQQANLARVLPTRHYSARDIQFDMDLLNVEPDPNAWEDPTQIGKDQERQNKSKTQLRVRAHRSWKIAPKNNADDVEGELGLFAKLPPRQTAWIILLHDLASVWKSESVTGNLVKRLLERLNNWSTSELKLNSQWKSEKSTGVKELRFDHLEKLMAERERTEDLDKYKKLTPSKDFLGWAVWQHDSTYKHFPSPNFETFRDLDRFLFVWSSGFEWLHELSKQANQAEERAIEAKADATQKRTKADRAKARVPQNSEGEQAEEAQKQAEAAEAEAKKAEDDATRKRAGADEAKKQVGGDEWINTYVHLWGLAGWVVINGKYDEFARRPMNWFKDQLATFQTSLTEFDMNEGSKESKDWLIKIKNFLRTIDLTSTEQNSAE